MTYGLNLKEESVWRRRDPDCDKFEERDDLVFGFPSELLNEADIAADKLQSAMDFLKNVTNLDPKEEFGSRVVVSYCHGVRDPNWSGVRGNRVYLPWDYLFKKNEPLDACSHELVHPYYNRSPLHNINEEWGDCFCEFLRGPIKDVMGLDGRAWWREKIKDKKSDKQNWGNVAGQFLLKAKEKYGAAKETDGDFADRFIEDRGAIKDFVRFLFDSFSELPMCLAFYPTTKVKLKFGDIWL